MSLGIRQLPDDNSPYYPWMNAPPGTNQELDLFLLVDDRLIREVFITPIPYNGTWAPDVIQSQSVLKLTADRKIEGLENLRPAFVKRDDIAWVGTHRHSPSGNEPYILCYLFKYRLDLPKGTTSVILPNNNRIRIMAMSVGTNANDDTAPAALLYE